MNYEKILAKITSRNYLAIITGTTLMFAVLYGLTNPTTVTTAIANPLLTYIMGQFGTVAVMVYVFYFRKPQKKDSTT